MNEEHKHAILIIRKDNKFLQYYDERWEGFLFPNLKMTDEFNENKIIEHISNILKINKDDINVDLLFNKIHSKFSESAKKYKTYNHYFYEVKINEIDRMFNENEFYNDTEYKWYTMEELENDDRIQKINSDIVGFVKNIKFNK